MAAHDRKEPQGLLVRFVRVWLPLLLAATGIGLVIAGGAHVQAKEGLLEDTLAGNGLLQSGLAAVGMALVLIALIVWMINWMFRLSIQSNRDREREEEAREYFDRHGYWPGEEGS
jgi:hypothetical protein